MAIQKLQARVDALYEKLYNKKNATKKFRKEIGSVTLNCTISVDHLAKTLYEQAQENGVQAELKDFKAYAKDVVRGYREHKELKGGKVKANRGNGVVELQSSSVTEIKFQLKGYKRNDMKFVRMNNKIHEAAIKLHPDLFESGKAKDNVEVAHAKGYSVVEAKLAVTQGLSKELTGATKNFVGPRGEDDEYKGLAGSAFEEDVNSLIKKLGEDEVTFGLDAASEIKVGGGEVSSEQTFEVQLESRFTNRADSKGVGGQTEMGKKLKALLEEVNAGLKAEALKAGAAGATEAESSRSPMQTVGDAIVNTKALQKAYRSKRAKNLSQYKKPAQKVPRKTAKSKRDKIKIQNQSLLLEGLPKGIKYPPKKKEKGATGVDEAFDMRHLLKIKNAINTRLPAEVRRNMSRPGLINRTGRFSDSAQIDSILPAAQTLLVKYSYRLNPYETFENNGKKKWPSGYNPKPLIAKSIRNLAMGMIDQKLTIRRT